MEVGGQAQLFWTLAVGLEYNDSDFIEIFNGCLDYPLPSWEAKEVRTLDFWGFIDVLKYRCQIVTPGQVLPYYRAAKSESSVKMEAEPVSLDKMVAEPVSADKMASIPEPPTVTYVMPESLAIMDTTSVFPVVMNAVNGDIFKAVPRHLRLASNLEDTPLMSVCTASFSKPTPDQSPVMAPAPDQSPPHPLSGQLALRIFPH